MSIPLKSDDPAYWMLERGRREEAEGKPRDWRSTPVVHDPECYICIDKEFELMGLPLCTKCPNCMVAGRGDGHIPADDDVCTVCGEGYPQGPDEEELV